MMTLKDEVANEYFEWMYDMVCGNRFADGISYRKLFSKLHSTRFKYSIRRDSNRAQDGVDLRHRFALLRGYRDIYSLLEGPCSVLEMMLALAIRCEEQIMDNPQKGDRTSQWFFGMITNLGLGAMTDEQYDRGYVSKTIKTFLDRDYEPDGRGGLFRVRHCDCDMRTIEIWYQLCRYLDTIE